MKNTLKTIWKFYSISGATKRNDNIEFEMKGSKI